MSISSGVNINTSVSGNESATEEAITNIVKYLNLINEGAVASKDLSNAIKNFLEPLPNIVTGSYTIDKLDRAILVNASAPNTQTLPSNSDIQLGQEFEIQDMAINASTHNITISCTSSQKIYGVGYSASGVSSITINTDGGMYRLRKIDTDKMLIVSKI